MKKFWECLLTFFHPAMNLPSILRKQEKRIIIEAIILSGLLAFFTAAKHHYKPSMQGGLRTNPAPALNRTIHQMWRIPQ